VVRGQQQQEAQKVWTDFTGSLEETLDLISANTSELMRGLFNGLLRLQRFTRDSARFVGEEFQTLEGDVRDVREELRRVHDDIESLATAGVSKVEGLAEISQQRLSMVLSSYQSD
jgi:hypothetical protein